MGYAPAPPVKVTVTDSAKAQDAYQTTLALPVVPPGIRFCPADYGVTYQLTFSLTNGRHVAQQALARRLVTGTGNARCVQVEMSAVS